MRTVEASDDKRRTTASRRNLRSLSSGVNIQFDVMNDALRTISTEEEHEGEENVSLSRQLSMRRSRTLNDIERDPGLAGSATPAGLPSVTFLTPSTPLRWKSSKRLELASEEKTPNANKPKEVVKEDVKTLNNPRQQDVVKDDVRRSMLSKPAGPEEEDRALESIKDKTDGLDSSKNPKSIIPSKGWLPKTDDADNALPSGPKPMVPERAAADKVLPSAGDAAGEVLSSNSETLVAEAVMAGFVAASKEGAKGVVIPNSEQVMDIVAEEKGFESSSDEKQVQGVDEQTKMCNKASAITTEQTTDQTSGGEAPGIERKSSAADEPSVITIEFLRARLLAERASSKAARERVQQLGKKVVELEVSLEQENQLRQKAEKDVQEALSKLQAVTVAGSATEESPEITKPAPDVPGVSGEQPGYVTRAALIATQTEPASSLDKMREEEKTALEHLEKHSEQDGARSMDYIKKGYAEILTSNQQSTSVDVMNEEGAETTEDTIVLQTTGQKSGGDTGQQHGLDVEKLDQAVEILQTENLQDVSLSLVPNMSSDPVVLNGMSIPGQTREEKRWRNIFTLIENREPYICRPKKSSGKGEKDDGGRYVLQRSATEERLRNMWDQMTQKMAALAEDQSQEDLVREELLNWMNQVPAVLQDILPKSSEEKTLVSSSSESTQQEDTGVLKVDVNHHQNEKKDEKEGPSLDGNLHADARSTSFESTNVAELIEQYEAQESEQQAWEQDYYEQQRAGDRRRRSSDSSTSRSNSGSGTPPVEGSQPDNQIEILTEIPYIALSPSIETVDGTRSPVMLAKGRSTDDFLPRIGSGKVDLHAPHFDALYSYPDSPSVPPERRGSRTHEGPYKSKEPPLVQREFGIKKPLDPTFLKPTFQEEFPVLGAHVRKEHYPVWVGRQQEQEHGDYQYLQGASRGGRQDNSPGYSGHGVEREEVQRSQANLGPRHSETAYGNWQTGSSPSSVRPHPQHERGSPYSQAGYSNAHLRPEAPSGFLSRNGERGPHHRQREVVSSSMDREYAAPWRSPIHDHGWPADGGSPHTERHEPIEAGFSRGVLQLPAQVRESLARPYSQSGTASPDTDVQTRVETPLTLAYPGWDLPRDDVQKPPYSNIDASSKVNEVLRALHNAKWNIQHSGSNKPVIQNRSAGPRGGEKTPPSRTGQGSDIPGGYIAPQPAGGLPPKDQRRFSTGQISESPKLLPNTSSGSSSKNPSGDSREDDSLSGELPFSKINLQSSYVDKMTVGHGIQFFFP